MSNATEAFSVEISPKLLIITCCQFPIISHELEHVDSSISVSPLVSSTYPIHNLSSYDMSESNPYPPDTTDIEPT